MTAAAFKALPSQKSKRREIKASKPLLFQQCCLQNSLDAPYAEYLFHISRSWRFDFAWPRQKIALEVEGGVWTKGRHTRPKGFLADCEKYNAAAVLGWRVLRVTPQTLLTTDTVNMVKEAMLCVMT